MAKIKLGQRPKSFKRTVSFPMLDGETGSVEVIFKYRTRREYGELMDKTFGGGEPFTDTDRIMETIQARTCAANADFLLAIAESWDLDEPLNHASAEQLANELPNAIAAIFGDYRKAVVEGHLGN
jgi:hypothetical protein